MDGLTAVIRSDRDFVAGFQTQACAFTRIEADDVVWLEGRRCDACSSVLASDFRHLRTALLKASEVSRDSCDPLRAQFRTSAYAVGSAYLERLGEGAGVKERLDATERLDPRVDEMDGDVRQGGKLRVE